MHIIALAEEPSSPRGGQERSLFEVCQNLAQRGHTIDLLHLRDGDLLAQYSKFCTHIIRVHSYKVKRKKDIFRFLSDLWKVPTGRNTVIYSNQYHDCFFGYALSVTRNIPLVCHIRTPAPKAIDASDWQLAVSLKRVGQFIPVSNQVQSDLVKLGFDHRKISVVNNGTNLDLFQPPVSVAQIRESWGISLDTKVVSYVGRLDQQKGVEVLLNAFALLCKQFTNAQLLVAGKSIYQHSMYQKDLEHRASELGIGEKVTFLGHVDNPALVYQVSDVAVVPSIFAEPFGRTVIEAMACGIPVVGSKIGGIPEILTGDFQRGLFQPENEQDLAEAIAQFLHWRQDTPELGSQCRHHVMQNFDLTKTVDRIEAILLQQVG